MEEEADGQPVNGTALKRKEPTEEEHKPLKVLGHETFVESKPLNTAAPWVKSATSFPAEIDKNTLSPLTAVNKIDPLLFASVEKNIPSWFPVQTATLPYLMQSSSVLPPRDIAICAPTGSGKTICFVLPVLNTLRGNRDASAVCALIVVPVQNLARQIEAEFQRFNVYKAKVVLLIGASDYTTERSKLFPNGSTRSDAHIIIATPGRLVEHLADLSGDINLRSLRYLIVDEADRMGQTARLEWLNLVERRANVPATTGLSIRDATTVSSNRWLQKILVSATLSSDIERLHRWRLRCPRLFRASAQRAKELTTSAPNEDGNAATGPADGQYLPSTLKHEAMTSELAMKPLALHTYLMRYPEWKRVLVFANNKTSSYRLTLLLKFLGKNAFEVEEFSSNLFGKRRQKVLQRFRNGKTRVLISSDAMSRGIDVPDIDCVVNYDTPLNTTIFIHRAGRTARAGKPGFLLTVVTKDERMKMKRALVDKGYWENVVDNRQDAKDFTSDFKEDYSNALKSLQHQLETAGKIG
ncbi:DEAD box protein/DEAH protein box helicase [Aphelenchoides avenae]|nr:DEAD box protein/DEAH protein box helicase [Aphelenchus avenae]